MLKYLGKFIIKLNDNCLDCKILKVPKKVANKFIQLKPSSPSMPEMLALKLHDSKDVILWIEALTLRFTTPGKEGSVA